MSKKVKDTDFLFISTRLRALEHRMLTRERLERMVEARSVEDAAKVLSECGFQGLEPLTAQTLEASLRRNRNETLAELAEFSPNSQIVDVFRMRYDYHNAKALIKCAASGQDPERLLLDAGRYPAGQLRDWVRTGELGSLPPVMGEAIARAQEVLAATGDPQRGDFILDRAYYAELTQAAAESGSQFLGDYVRLQIDAANLKSAVRAMRMRKNMDFLKEVLVEGGNVEKSAVATAAATGASLEGVFSGRLREAAALGDRTVKGGPQTAFERACDNALGDFLRTSRMVPFGDSVVIAYAAAKENDITAARIILSGRMAGVPTESIRERLREAYV